MNAFLKRSFSQYFLEKYGPLHLYLYIIVFVVSWYFSSWVSLLVYNTQLIRLLFWSGGTGSFPNPFLSSIAYRGVVSPLELTAYIERTPHKTTKWSSNTESKVGKVGRQQVPCLGKQKYSNSQNMEPLPLSCLKGRRHILGSPCQQFEELRDRHFNTPVFILLPESPGWASLPKIRGTNQLFCWHHSPIWLSFSFMLDTSLWPHLVF